MQKIVFIIILNLLLAQLGYAQNQAVTKILMPQKISIRLLKTSTTPAQPLPKNVYIDEPVNISLLHFNDQPVLKLKKTSSKRFMLLTELSFSDVFENSMNGLKVYLINTYDGHIPELFNDAPSLFKIKCILSL